MPCLPPDLYDTFVATCARAPRWFNMLTEQLKEVLALEIAAQFDPVESEKSVSRMTLRQMLMTGLEDVIMLRQGVHRLRAACRRHCYGALRRRLDCDRRPAGRRRWCRLAGRQSIPPAGAARKTRGSSPSPESCRSPRSRPDSCRRRVFEGISIVQAPKGYFCILHVMEFKWDRAGKIKNGIGDTDAELIKRLAGVAVRQHPGLHQLGLLCCRGQVSRQRDGASR